MSLRKCRQCGITLVGEIGAVLFPVEKGIELFLSRFLCLLVLAFHLEISICQVCLLLPPLFSFFFFLPFPPSPRPSPCSCSSSSSLSPTSPPPPPPPLLLLLLLLPHLLLPLTLLLHPSSFLHFILLTTPSSLPLYSSKLHKHNLSYQPNSVPLPMFYCDLRAYLFLPPPLSQLKCMQHVLSR